MATNDYSNELLKACVAAAVNLGEAQALNNDTAQNFVELKEAIQTYIDSFWYLPYDEQPKEEIVKALMINNAYLAYLYILGELPDEQVSSAFSLLHQLNNGE